MSADELHVNNLIVEVDVYNQSVVIASDIEHNAAIAEKTRVPVGVLDILRTPPGGFRCLRVPRPQRLLRSLVSLPEFTKGSASDDAQLSRIPCSHFGNNYEAFGIRGWMSVTPGLGSWFREAPE